MKRKIVSIIGLGYIGLPTAALLASKGYTVLGTDISQRVVDTINQGKIHIVEPDLEPLVRSSVTAGRLRASTSAQAGDVYIICVPTPLHESNGVPQPNIDYVLAATRSIAIFIKAGDLVILESTSPVGTTEQMEGALCEYGVTAKDVHIAYCPERVWPGNIMTELVQNDRVVGGLTPAATKAAADFYRTFVNGDVLETEAKTAEMCKLTENSFRDLNIAFANELSLICEKEGINIWNLIQLANRHPRVNILQPGVGVGGHCIAVDPWFIVSRDIKNTRLIHTARKVNNHKTHWVIDKIKATATKAAAKIGRKPVIACLGLAFKPDIDDLRESPAITIVESLLKLDYKVLAVEPNIKLHPQLPITELSRAIKDADLIVILVKHKEFLQENIKLELKKSECMDFCGLLS